MRIYSVSAYPAPTAQRKPVKNSAISPNFGSKLLNPDKYGKIIYGTTALTAGIMAGASKINDALKMDEKKLDSFMRENEWSPGRFPKIYYASPEEAKRIREIMVSNDKATEIPSIYLGLRDGRLYNDLENHDLSAVPDILSGIEAQKNKIFKFGHYDDMLQVIYRFLYNNAENLTNDDFTAKLDEILNYVKEKRNEAFEDVSERIEESTGDTELLLMTKHYLKNYDRENIKADIVKNTFENTLTLSSSNIFVADKNAENYKMGAKIFEKFLDEQYFTDYRAYNPPIWDADSKEAEIIRKVFIDNGRPDYLLDLYLRVNNAPIERNCLLLNNLNNFDLSAMPDMIKALNSKDLDSKNKYKFSDLMLVRIYTFLNNNMDTLEDSKFMEELGKYINILNNNVEDYQKHNNILSNSSSNVLKEIRFHVKYGCYETPKQEKEIKSDFVKSLFGTPYRFPKDADYKNIDTLINLLKSDDAVYSQGAVINFDPRIINSIADIIPQDVNPDKYSEMIGLLKKLPKADYNQKDEYGISVIEKIINAENAQLLDVVKDKNIKYLPELDYTYENVQDTDFFEKIKKVDFDISEITRAIFYHKADILNKYDDSLQYSKIILFNQNILDKLKNSLLRSSRPIRTYFQETYPVLCDALKINNTQNTL